MKQRLDIDFQLSSAFRSQGEDGEERLVNSASVVNVSNRFMNFVGHLGIPVNLRKSAGASRVEQRNQKGAMSQI